MIDTKELRSAVESAGLNAISGEEVLELIDRLEAAEKEGDTMRTKISDLTINVEYLGNLKKSYEELIGELQDDRDALRSKIEAMGRQEPVGKFIRHPSNGLWEQDGYGANPDARPLYALPGAQTRGEGK